MKHPSNRAERLRLKKIKDFEKEIKSGGIRKRSPDERLDHELIEFEIPTKAKEESLA